MLLTLLKRLFTATPSSAEAPGTHSPFSDAVQNQSARNERKRRSRSRTRSKKKSRNPTYLKNASTIPNYSPRNDGTSIDNFVKALKEALPTGVISISVSGLTTHPRRAAEKGDWISVIDNPVDERRWSKQYKIGLIVQRTFLSLDSRIDKLPKAEPDGEANYFETILKPLNGYLNDEIFNLIPQYKKSSHASVGFKSDGTLSIWINTRLPISLRDVVIHCGGELTDYPIKFLDDFIQEVEERLDGRFSHVITIYQDYDFRYKFLRQAEQGLRKSHDVPLIGEGNVTQQALYKLIKRHFPNAKYEHSPKWLGSQRLDIYLPHFKTAVEYNGPQHYQPVEFFGGEEGFKETQRRDQGKKRLCEKNGITLIEWHYSRNVNEVEVINFIKEHLQSKTNEQPKPPEST